MNAYSTRKIASRLLISLCFVFVASVLIPSDVKAADMTAMSTTVAAQASTTCQNIAILSVHPYIYNGDVHSFDVVVSTSSLIVLQGKVGSETVPFRYFTYWERGIGGSRIHVDIPTTPLFADTPYEFTAVSLTPSGQIACLTRIAGVFAAAKSYENLAQYAPPTTNTPSYVPTTPLPVKPVSATVKPTKPAPTGNVYVPVGNNTPVAQPAPATSTINPGIVAASNSMGNLCLLGGGGKLWVILLVLYALFVALLAFQKDNTSSLISSRWNTGLILAVLLALIFFWYVSSVCRTGAWAPIVAILIACFGVVAILAQYKTAEEVLLLKNASSPVVPAKMPSISSSTTTEKVIITPPPTIVTKEVKTTMTPVTTVTKEIKTTTKVEKGEV